MCCGVMWYDVVRLVSRLGEDGHCGWSQDVMLCDLM